MSIIPVQVNNKSIPEKISSPNQQQQPAVLVQKYKNTRHLTLNKPKDLNCIWMESMNILTPYLKVWEQSDEAKLITISGTDTANYKLFSAGGDLKNIAQVLAEGTTAAKHEMIGNIGRFYELLQFINTMSTPVIAIMDGITMGGGAGLIGQAPFRIATENTVYAMPENILGSFTDSTATFALSRYDDNLGLFLGLTGTRLYAEDALFCGFATHFVHSSKLEEMKKRLSDLEGNTTHDTINLIIDEYAVKLDHVPLKFTLHGEKMKIIQQCFKYNTVEEVIKALALNGSKFALSCVAAISKGSPTSLKVIMECLRRAKTLSYNTCCRMEFRMWQRTPYTHDMKEGILGQVMGKRARNWNPNRLEDVDVEDDVLVKIFEAVETHHLHFITNERDYFDNPHSQYSLPSAKEIEREIHLHNFENMESAIAWFEKTRPGKFGVRQKVKDYLERHGYYFVKPQQSNSNVKNQARL